MSFVPQLIQALKCADHKPERIKLLGTGYFFLFIFFIPFCIVESHQGWVSALPSAA